MKVTRNIDTGDEKQTIRTISTKPKEHFEGRWKSGRLYPLYSVVVNNGTTFISQNAKMKEEPYVIYDADKKEFKAPDGWLIKEMSADSRVTALGGGGEGGVTPEEVEEMIKDKVDKVNGKGLSTNDYDNTEKNKVASAYQKPNNGIPKSDLAKAVQDLLDYADGAYKKPVTGIPFTDLADGVQDSLSNADEAKAGLAGKQDTISDLSAIRSGAAAGATSVQPAEFNELKDEVDTIGNGAYEEAWDGDSTPVVADIPAGVVVTYSSASYTGTLAASASTVDKIYLVSDGNGNYDRYTTVEANGAYSWKKVGSTAIPLSNYATNAKVSQLQQKFYKFGDNVAVNTTAANWKLKGDGLSASDSTAQMRKFKVEAGQMLYLKLSADTPGVYQWQNAANVPGTGTNSYLVGSPVTTETDAVVVVPLGATYLIISELKTNETNVVKYATSLAGMIDNAQDELDREFGYEDTHTLVAGRDNTGPKINMKSGVQYRLTAQLDTAPVSGYASVDIYDSSGTAIYHIYNIKDADVHILDITPAQDYENAYISFYASGDATASSPCKVTFRQLDSIAQEVDDVQASLGFAEIKKLITAGGRHDITTKFNLIAGKKYILTAQLADVPTAYVTITLKDANNNTLLDLGQRKDTSLVSGVYEADADYKNAYIYIFASANGSAKAVSVGFAELGTRQGDILEQMGKALITDVNPPKEMMNRILQARRKPRVGSTTQGITPLVLLHFSDLHGSERELKRIVEYRKAYNNYIDDVIDTGDNVPLEASEGVDFFDSVEGAENILNTIGNHDSRANGEWTGYGAVASYEQYIKPYVENWGVTQPENAEENGYNYYYKDYADAKVRLIVLDCMFWDSTEKTWLESVLADAKTEGLAVVVCSHYPGGNVTRFNTPWASLQYADVSQTTDPEAATAISEFIEGGGEFVCWLSGHTHYDFVGKLTDFPEQVNITIDCANELAGNTGYSDIERVVGTRSQDLFNIVAVDTFRKLIKVFRVGADRDSWMRHRGDLCIKYDTQEVLYFD